MKQVWNPGLDRRQMVKALSALGASLVTYPILAPRARAADKLTGMTWSGYDVPQLMGDYLKKYGSKPNFTYIGTDEQAFQKVRAGFTPDFIHPGSYMVKEYVDAGLIQPIDTGRVKTWPDLAPGMVDLHGTVIDGKHYLVPSEFGNSSVVYRTDLVDPAYAKTNSWAIMYDERYKGRLAWRDRAEPTIEVAGLMKGFHNIFSLNGDQLAAIKPLMIKQRDVTRFYWSDISEVEQAIASGEIVAAYAWNASYSSLLSKGVPVGYMTPKEGIMAWGSGFVIDKHAKDLQAVYDYIDAWTSPQSGAWMMDHYGYGSANLKAYDLLKPERRKQLGYEHPEQLIASTIFMEGLAPDTKKKYEALYNDVRAGG